MVTKDDYRKCFQEEEKRWNKCSASQGDYFRRYYWRIYNDSFLPGSLFRYSLPVTKIPAGFINGVQELLF